jgi:hypothetical protein
LRKKPYLEKASIKVKSESF